VNTAQFSSTSAEWWRPTALWHDLPSVQSGPLT